MTLQQHQELIHEKVTALYNLLPEAASIKQAAEYKIKTWEACIEITKQYIAELPEEKDGT